MRQIRHIGIYVDNLEMMKNFYCDNFDMSVAIHDFETGKYISELYNMPEESITVELYKLINAEGSMIELLKIQPDIYGVAHADEIFKKGCSHIAFSVSCIEKMYKELKAGGLDFYSAPLLSRDERHMVCICKDPEGNYLELVQEL